MPENQGSPFAKPLTRRDWLELLAGLALVVSGICLGHIVGMAGAACWVRFVFRNTSDVVWRGMSIALAAVLLGVYAGVSLLRGTQ